MKWEMACIIFPKATVIKYAVFHTIFFAVDKHHLHTITNFPHANRLWSPPVPANAPTSTDWGLQGIELGLKGCDKGQSYQ